MDEVEQIKSRIDVVEFISEYLPLKKTGRNFSALCPFHTEKTPSFMVSPDRQIWRCFGCGKSGDVFTFLQEKEGLEFAEALELLAQKVGVKLKPKVGRDQAEKEKLLAVSELAAKFYQSLLWEDKIGKLARDYLAKRGISFEIARQFGIGYAPASKQLLSNALIKRGFDLSLQAQAGLVVASDRGVYYDRFHSRLIFPIKDITGKVVGFAGRLIVESKTSPKYINSPETKIFSKGSLLFGLDQAKDEIQNLNEVILVEGEFDMLSSYQAGVRNVVAVKGTSLTERQVDLIKRFCETVVLCFDADVAGDAAARRSIEMLDKAGLNTKVIHLGQNKDPADLIKTNPNSWKEKVQTAVNIFDFLIDSALRRYDVSTALGKKKVGQELLPILARISNDLVKAHYLKQLSLRIDIPEEIIYQAIAKNDSAKVISEFQQKTSIMHTTIPRREKLSEMLLALLLQGSGTFIYDQKILPEVSDLENEILKSIYKTYIIFVNSEAGKLFDLNEFITSLQPEERDLADRLVLVNLGDIVVDAKLFERTLIKVSNELKRLSIRAKMKEVTDLILKAEEEGDQEKLVKLNKKLNYLSERLSILNNK